MRSEAADPDAARADDAPEWRERAAAVADADESPVALPRGLLLEVYQHARECYPEECCGLLIGPPGGPPARVVRCTNVQSRRRSRGESELDARRAFWIDELELLAALRAAEARGEQLQMVYHSHIDTAAYLSHTDLRGALGADAQPLWPGVAQLVVSVYESGVRDAALFEWEPASGAYRGRAVAGADAEEERP